MNRRTFLSMLAGLPFIGGLVYGNETLKTAHPSSTNHSDTEEYLDHLYHIDLQYHIDELDRPECLGSQERDDEEIYQLAKLWKNGDPMWKSIYMLMARYPDISFAEAQALQLLTK